MITMNQRIRDFLGFRFGLGIRLLDGFWLGIFFLIIQALRLGRGHFSFFLRF